MVEILDLSTTPFGKDKNACLSSTPEGPTVDSVHVSMLIASAARQASGPFLLKGLRMSRRFFRHPEEIPPGKIIKLNPAYERVRLVSLSDDGLILEKI